MEQGRFRRVGAFPGHPLWEQMICREEPIRQRDMDLRTDFVRDYSRIIHSTGYRRLKRKTQMCYSPESDHLCTRMEHVHHVDLVAYIIAGWLGLNTELCRAIAVGHDLGHAPFGHLGEKILSGIRSRELGENFWHERNGIRFAGHLELIRDSWDKLINLNLTYAVRDGIISHCGEVDDTALRPREQAIDLDDFENAGAFQPFTWEGCLVKLSDKIAYLGRDIEDALALNIITKKQLREFTQELNKACGTDLPVINTSNLTHIFTGAVCHNSSVEEGIRMTPQVSDLMRRVKAFNYEFIYAHERLHNFHQHAENVLNTLYRLLAEGWDGADTDKKLEEKAKTYPGLFNPFHKWLSVYWDAYKGKRGPTLANKIVYHIKEDEREYKRAVIDYLSGMTDDYALRMFQDLFVF